jgi:hypothetical protein
LPTHASSEEICSRNVLYELFITEIWDEEAEEKRSEISSKYPDIPPDRIGAFNPEEGNAFINVPPRFMDVLWTAAVAADGVIRSIDLRVQPQGQSKQHWAIFDISLSERIADIHELGFDKNGDPKVSPPRPDPAVIELRGMRARLDILVIAVGVLIVLLVARLR